MEHYASGCIEGVNDMMDKGDKGIKEAVNVAWISGWFFIVLWVLSKASPWFFIAAKLGVGIGAIIYLFNIAILILLIRYRKIYFHGRFYKRNLFLILVYLALYPFLFISIMEGG
jgi:hypothetical protein